MFNIGFTELIAIAVIALVFIGPQQLPEIAKILGKLMGEFRKATNELAGGLLDVKRQINTTIQQAGDIDPAPPGVKKAEKPQEVIPAPVLVQEDAQQVVKDEPESKS